MVLYVDMREHGSDLVVALVKALEVSDLHAKVLNTLKSIAGSVASFLFNVSDIALIRNFVVQLSDSLEKKHRKEKSDMDVLSLLLDTFIKTSQDKGRFPCLIIDEANKALQAKTDSDKARTIAVLYLLVRRTKQLRSMNVLLASSEHGEPEKIDLQTWASMQATFNLLYTWGKCLCRTCALNGYVCLDFQDDPFTIMISEENIGGVVASEFTDNGIPGLFSGFTPSTASVIVPTDQMTRLVVLRYLIQNKLLYCRKKTSLMSETKAFLVSIKDKLLDLT
jgi:hypothetical protein